MTQNRARNKAIRARMERTGETFTQASRALTTEREKAKRKGQSDGGSSVRDPRGSTRIEFSDEDSED